MFLFVEFINAKICVLIQPKFSAGELVLGNQLAITNVTILESSGSSPEIWIKVVSVMMIERLFCANQPCFEVVNVGCSQLLQQFEYCCYAPNVS